MIQKAVSHDESADDIVRELIHSSILCPFFYCKFQKCQNTKGLWFKFHSIHSQGAKKGRSDGVRIEGLKLVYIYVKRN
jgi:hypothetical protein